MVIVERLLDLDGIVIGVPEIAAERRACVRVNSMMSAKAANGVSALRAAARRFGSWVHARFTVTP